MELIGDGVKKFERVRGEGVHWKHNGSFSRELAGERMDFNSEGYYAAVKVLYEPEGTGNVETVGLTVVYSEDSDTELVNVEIQCDPAAKFDCRGAAYGDIELQAIVGPAAY